jgi:hypothetical protein
MKCFRNIALAFAVMGFFHVDQLTAQTTDSTAIRFAKSITSEELKEHLYVISSDAFEGRETGMPGQKKAAAYLADYYSALGVAPCVEGSYFQTYPLKKEQVKSAWLVADGKRFEFAKDFFFFNSSAVPDKIDLSAMVFAGFGIDSPEYSDYKKLDVSGKVVVCYLGEPVNKKGISKITGKSELSEWSLDPGMKMMAAQERGASAVLFIHPDYAQFIPRVRFWLDNPGMELEYPSKENGDKNIPFFFIKEEVASALVKEGKSKKQLTKLLAKINKSGKTKSISFSTASFIHVERSLERITAENVLCFIEGSDDELKDEIVVVSAHYDHVGIIKGEIHNGADDDGSGTVAAMEIAEAFVQAKKEGKGPRRSVLVLHVSGEEKGLLGSEWYSEFPVFPLGKTVCDLNIDMIGRKDEAHVADSNYIYLIGSDRLSTDLHVISENANATYTQLQLDYTFNEPNDPNRFYYRSDHYNFAKHGIPVIFYFSGVHEDYHKPGDDPEKIMYEKTERVTRLIFHTAWEVANRQERLVVDKATPEP